MQATILQEGRGDRLLPLRTVDILVELSQQVKYIVSMDSDTFELFNTIECGYIVPSSPRF
jgi:hypothetical protein